MRFNQAPQTVIVLGFRTRDAVDGFSAAQRFFLSWAQTYRGKMREPQLRRDVVSDPHSPTEFRVNGVVRNMDAWYEAFDVRPGDWLYLAPGDRVRVW
jgi:putative endopeptidase